MVRLSAPVSQPHTLLTPAVGVKLPAEGSTVGSAKPASVAAAGDVLGKGTLLRLRGGTTVKSAAKIAGSRRRLAIKHRRAATDVAKSLADKSAAQPASDPKPSSPPNLPELSDASSASSEFDAEMEETDKGVENEVVVASLQAQLEEVAEAASERKKARTTKARAAKKLLKQQLTGEVDKPDKVESPPPNGDADPLASKLAKLVGHKSASASSKFDPCGPKPFRTLLARFADLLKPWHCSLS